MGLAVRGRSGRHASGRPGAGLGWMSDAHDGGGGAWRRRRRAAQQRWARCGEMGSRQLSGGSGRRAGGGRGRAGACERRHRARGARGGLPICQGPPMGVQR